MDELKTIAAMFLQNSLKEITTSYAGCSQQYREELVGDAIAWAKELEFGFYSSRRYVLHVDKITWFPSEDIIEEIEEKSFTTFADAQEYTTGLGQRYGIDPKDQCTDIYIVETINNQHSTRYFNYTGSEVYLSLHDWMRPCRYLQPSDSIGYAFHFDDLDALTKNAEFAKALDGILEDWHAYPWDAAIELDRIISDYGFDRDFCLNSVYIVKIIVRKSDMEDKLEIRMIDPVYNINRERVAPTFQSKVRFESE